ncbi:recombinase-like helix-turn-helix domain-containing protein [Variovorax sp. YR216]|uniref:recombinase-like helix-turn-helix domain-containing protein n=1 Tax=Variovorax sp. YR216 TaxID=1882828 RepID=UPI001C409B56|nr:recombinase-like helix-turn-helix domain-containing protein [Variovorax sp. YR216]
MERTMTDRYLDPHQARTRTPTTYEDLLGDAIERAYAAGIHDLASLVESLNNSGLSSPSGQLWTEAIYRQEIAALGN